MTQRTYRALRDDAESALRQGRSVIVDASFARAAQRGAFATLARSLVLPFLVVETRVWEETIRARMRARARDPRETSDADFGTYVRMLETFETPSELEERHVLRAEPNDQGEDTTARAIDRLVGQTTAQRAGR